MSLPIDRTAKAALDTNLNNGITADAPKVKASNDVVYNTIDELKGYVDSTLQGIYDANKFTKLGIINVKDAPFNAKGDGVTDDTPAINRAIAAMADGGVLYFPSPSVQYRITSTLTTTKNNIQIIGNYSLIGFDANVDLPVFTFLNQRNVLIKGICSGNTATAQTFVKATSTHHLHVTDGNFDGMKLGFDLTNCYWAKLESLRFQSTYQLFKFYSATNAFHVVNVSIKGAGIPSTIDNCTSGGNISGCSFESLSGRINITKSYGINIDGNYFEGFDAVNVTSYISLGAANYTDTNGINITGNLFYTGAASGIKLYNVSGINIAGNFFGCTHALELYTYAPSVQHYISYAGNHYDGNYSVSGLTPAQEFLITGPASNASVSPEIAFPFIFKDNKLAPKTLATGDLALYSNGERLIKSTPTFASSQLLEGIQVAGQNLAASASVTVSFESTKFVIGFLTICGIDQTNKSALYVVIRNTNNINGDMYLYQIYNTIGINATSGTKTFTFTNSNTITTYFFAAFSSLM